MVDYTGIGLEGSAVLLVLVVVFKLYKMKIRSSSGCCGDSIHIETENQGGRADIDF